MPVNTIPQKINVEFTYNDIVEFGNEGDHWEIFDGELVVSPPPNVKHQVVSGNLHQILRSFFHQKRLGKLLAAPIGVYFDVKTFFEPDLVYVSNENKNRIKENYIEGAPDLVVEIISPSSVKRDRGYKFRRYALEGVQEYWIVDPINEVVEIFELTAEGFQLMERFSNNQQVRSKMLQDFQFKVSEIWD